MRFGEGIESLESHTHTGHGGQSDSAKFLMSGPFWACEVPAPGTSAAQNRAGDPVRPESPCARKWGVWRWVDGGEHRGELGIVAGMATPFPALDGSAPVTKEFAQAPEFGIDTSKRYTATMDTTLGTMVIALDAVNAPNTVNNFVFLAAHHYYDGVVFHRIINGFMCQGGDPTGTGRGGPGYRFNDEPVKQK